MPKKSGKQAAALQREAVKRNEAISVTLPLDPSLTTDPSYVPPENADTEIRPSTGADREKPVQFHFISFYSILDAILQVIPAKRKQNLDADLIPHRKLVKAEKSRSTEWREKTGKTKKAKAANMQSSVASIFNVCFGTHSRCSANSH
jgi:hypothetical protein